MKKACFAQSYMLADGLYISDVVRDYVLEAAGEGKKISAKDEEKQIK